MSENRHTPGPWIWSEDADDTGHMGTVLDDGGVLVCDFGSAHPYDQSAGIPPEGANRALMLAAPDLLAACEAVLLETDAGLGLVRAAIAKAKGGVPASAEQKPHPEFERGVKASARFVRTWSTTPRPGGRRDRLASDMVRELLAPKGGES